MFVIRERLYAHPVVVGSEVKWIFKISELHGFGDGPPCSLITLDISTG